MATELAEQTTNPPTRAVEPARFRRIMDVWATEAAVQVGAKGTKIADELPAQVVSYTAELAGPSPSPIERTLAETAALCWFTLRYAQGIYDRTTGLHPPGPMA